jgi:hypothetical protein
MGFWKKIIKANYSLFLLIIVILITSVLINSCFVYSRDIDSCLIRQCLNPRVQVKHAEFAAGFEQKYRLSAEPLIKVDVKGKRNDQSSKRTLNKVLRFFLNLVWPVDLDKLIFFTVFVYVLFVPAKGMIYEIHNLTESFDKDSEKHHIINQLAVRFPGFKNTAENKQNRQKTPDFLDDLSDAIAELILSLHRRDSANKTGSTAWAIKIMNNELSRNGKQQRINKQREKNKKDPSERKGIDTEKIKNALEGMESIRSVNFYDAKIILTAI